METRTYAVRSRPVTRYTLLAFMLLALLMATSLLAGDAQAQIRRAGRLQKKLEKMQQRRGANKLNPSTGTANGTANGAVDSSEANPLAPSAPKPVSQTGKHSLDGARERGVRGIIRDEERELLVPGFGNPAAMVVILRQLDLTEEQKQSFRALRQRNGNRLALLQKEHQQLDAQLTDAIYGENFDPKRAEELAAQVAEKQGELIKMRAGIESQFRQILTPDQFYVFHFLVGEMMLPGRRIPPAQLRQQMLQQRRLNPANRPPQEN